MSTHLAIRIFLLIYRNVINAVKRILKRNDKNCKGNDPQINDSVIKT